MTDTTNPEGGTHNQPFTTNHRPDPVPKSHRALTPAQLNAIDCLLVGKNDRETAEAVGVCRQTVTRWRLTDWFFQSELKRKRAQLWNGALDRLRSLIPKAIDVLEFRLSKNNGDFGLQAVAQLFKLMKPGGLLQPNSQEQELYTDFADEMADLPVPVPPPNDQASDETLLESEPDETECDKLRQIQELVDAGSLQSLLAALAALALGED